MPLTKDDPNLAFGGYEVRARKDFAEIVRELVNEADEIYKQDVENFPSIHFDRHLYQPLLVSDAGERMETTPPALNEGEAQFVADLREYLERNTERFDGKEVFLLRNLTRGRGIGFFEASEGEAFYPDFILWVIEDGRQRIVFIDPHGLRMARGGFNDPKMCLHERLKALEPTLQEQCPQWRVHLASLILSTSPYDEIRRAFGTGQHTKGEFAEHNVLFTEDSGYIEKCMGRTFA